MQPYDRYASSGIEDTLGRDASILSVADALALVQRFADVCTRRDGEAFAEGFTEDCLVSHTFKPPLRGRKAVREFFVPRFASLPESFHCEKTLRAMSGNVIGVEYHNSWIDPESGQVAHGRGAEFWIMQDQQIARWDVVYAIAVPNKPVIAW